MRKEAKWYASYTPGASCQTPLSRGLFASQWLNITSDVCVIGDVQTFCLSQDIEAPPPNGSLKRHRNRIVSLYIIIIMIYIIIIKLYI